MTEYVDVLPPRRPWRHRIPPLGRSLSGGDQPMNAGDQPRAAEDAKRPDAPGPEQQLERVMGPFASFAISMATICILSGGITSFHVGLCSVGGASIGLGWPLGCLFSLTVALTMGQVASA